MLQREEEAIGYTLTITMRGKDNLVEEEKGINGRK